MTTEPENIEMEPVEPEPDEFDGDEEESLNVVEKVVGVFISPVQTFTYLARKPDFWSALIILSLIGIALQMLVLPKTMPLIEAATVEAMQEAFDAQGATEAERDAAIQTMLTGTRIGSYIMGTIGVPIALAITWLLSGVLIFFVSMIQGLDTDFKRIMGVYPWTNFITLIPQIISTLFLMNASLESMDQTRDFRLLKPYSLLALIPQSADLPLWQEALISSIDPFTIWLFFILAIALEKVNRCTRSQAYVTSGITIVVSIIVTSLLAGLGSAMGQGA